MANDKDFRIKNGLQLGGSLVEAVGTITGTTLDLTSGNVFSYTPTAETTFVFSNPPATGTCPPDLRLELNGEFIDGGYDLANAEPPAYGRFSVAAQETNPSGMFFKPDGTKMYVIGFTGDDVNEYDLSTAWDITTASYLQNFSVAAQEQIHPACSSNLMALRCTLLGLVEMQYGNTPQALSEMRPSHTLRLSSGQQVHPLPPLLTVRQTY